MEQELEIQCYDKYRLIRNEQDIPRVLIAILKSDNELIREVGKETGSTNVPHSFPGIKRTRNSSGE